MPILRCDSLTQWREELVPVSGLQVDFEPYHDAPFEALCNIPLDLPGIFEPKNGS